ncbi:hypothetical protein [Clostridium intestinale]|nr:hypothetical protein [Clostridium intestinale]
MGCSAPIPGSQYIIADYLWCPYDELPENLWEQVQSKNEIGLDRIYKLDEDEQVD